MLLSVESDQPLQQQTAVQDGPESLFESMFAQVDMGLACLKVVLDKDGCPVDYVYFYVNQKMSNLLQYNNLAITGMKFWEYYSHSDRENDEFFELMNSTYITGKPHNTSFYNNQLDKWFYLGIKKLNDSFLLVQLEDHTFQKKIEHELRESETKYRSLFNYMSIGHAYYRILFDENNQPVDYVVEDVNPAYETLTGFTRSQVVGRRGTELAPNIIYDKRYEIILKVAVDKKPRVYEYLAPRVQRWFSTMYYSPKPGYTAILLDDITERKKTLDDLMEAKEKAEENSQFKSEYIANLSHELRTPLNVMMGAIQLFSMYATGSLEENRERIVRHLSSMRQNSLRMLRMVNNLIDSTKIDVGFYELRIESHDIVNVIRRMTLSVSEYVQMKNIELAFSSNEESMVMGCDVDILERILLNLISNAYKYTGNNGKIKVSMAFDGQSCMISVKDNGIGIPDEKLDLIFERFRQVDSLMTREHEGSGIGLSLVKSLVELHGGMIQVKSKCGEGSEFIVLLPSGLLPATTDRSCQSGCRQDNQNFIERMHVEFSDIYQ